MPLHPRRFFGAALVLLMLSAVPARAGIQDTRSALQAARDKIHTLGADIAAKQKEIAGLQKQTDVITARYDAAQTKLAQIAGQLVVTQQAERDAQQRYEKLRSRLDQRARIAYENGPASGLDFVLGASSLQDMNDRLEYVGAVAQSDADLATQSQNLRNTLAEQAARLSKLQDAQKKVTDELQAQAQALTAKLAEQKSAYAALNSARKQAEALQKRYADKLSAQLKARAAALAAAQSSPVTTSGGGTVTGHPFQTCPVNGPHSYSDSFGAPRNTTVPPHPHAGNDIMAPMGTPIVAPFSGNASGGSDGLGGLTVTVYGSQGYVYNAHLSKLGQTGQVSAGTVVGYVGNSGDAAGGPTHDHFEWHPSSIPSNPWRSPYGYTVINGAIDPYPYLNQVC